MLACRTFHVSVWPRYLFSCSCFFVLPKQTLLNIEHRRTIYILQNNLRELMYFLSQCRLALQRKHLQY
jgi:hypothetical protein